MEEINGVKGFVIEINSIIGLFSCKTQQITNLLQHGVAIYFPTTYNTTNKLLSDQFICTHNYSFFCIELSQILNLFQLQYIVRCIFLPNFIIKNHYKLHIMYANIYKQILMHDTRFTLLTCILWCS